LPCKNSRRVYLPRRSTSLMGSSIEHRLLIAVTEAAGRQSGSSDLCSSGSETKKIRASVARGDVGPRTELSSSRTGGGSSGLFSGGAKYGGFAKIAVRDAASIVEAGGAALGFDVAAALLAFQPALFRSERRPGGAPPDRPHQC